jgi:hypothetical protein
MPGIGWSITPGNLSVEFDGVVSASFGLVVPQLMGVAFDASPSFAVALVTPPQLAVTFAGRPSFTAALAESEGGPTSVMFGGAATASFGLLVPIYLGATFNASPSFTPGLTPPMNMGATFAGIASATFGLVTPVFIGATFNASPSFTPGLYVSTEGVTFQGAPSFAPSLIVPIHLGVIFQGNPSFSPAGGVPGTCYHIYANSGVNDPINYSIAIATVTGLTWTSAALPYPAQWLFGVRPFDRLTGFEDQNVDAYVSLVLDAAGVDITGRPNAPQNVSARATVNGGCRIEWDYRTGSQGGPPVSFLVWLTAGAIVNYMVAPVGTVGYIAGTPRFRLDVPPTSLADGAMYTAGVRATNGVATEPNTSAVATVTGDATPPLDVDGLTAVVQAQT